MIICTFTLLFVTTLTTAANEESNTKCVLPPHPEHGSYTMARNPKAMPGDIFNDTTLHVTCRDGYALNGANKVSCHQGAWSAPLPTCVSMCKLSKRADTIYNCRTPNSNDTRECKEFELGGTIVVPKCSKPDYFTWSQLPPMRCIDGSWDYIATCTPECGRISVPDLLNKSQQNYMPWVVSIYTKTVTPPSQICFGSLVTTKAVLSAAHCFGSIDDVFPASDYIVAAGKQYRPFSDQRDANAQISDVEKIKIPMRYKGGAANYQNDIAVVTAKTPFKYNAFVSPICLNFDTEFEKNQLQGGVLGKVATWAEKKGPINMIDLPYMEISQCIKNARPESREYLTSDKMCAGYVNNTSAICRGDSGSGYYIPASNEEKRYYLRGIVSTSPRPTDSNCVSIVFLTQIGLFEDFIVLGLK